MAQLHQELKVSPHLAIALPKNLTQVVIMQYSILHIK